MAFRLFSSLHVIWPVLLWSILLLSTKGHSLSDFETPVDPGEPLFLTPLIQDGRLDEAKNLSRVGPSVETDVISYTGYLTVNQEYNSNMFFWFIPALNYPETAPVVLWLQGGPGGSSMLSLFFETGPWRLTPDLDIHKANYTWSSLFNMLYFDSPVGTGFSFTDDHRGYATNEDDVAKGLYNALQQFFTLFSEYQKQEFYLAGESYAGKYIPAIGHKIHVENPEAVLPINLKGLSIGNGLIDPKTQIKYGDFLYNAGLIDSAQRGLFYEQENLTVANIEAGDYVEALLHYDMLVIGQFTRKDSYFGNFTGLHDIYNILVTEGPVQEEFYSTYLDLPQIRQSIHVGNLTFHNSYVVVKHLRSDIMNSSKPWLEELLDANYKVLIYSGIVDSCIPYAVTQDMLATLEWKHSQEYKDADRVVWKVTPSEQEVAGYAKRVRNFQEVAIRNAGHMAPSDQPRAVLDMIARFVYNKTF